MSVEETVKKIFKTMVEVYFMMVVICVRYIVVDSITILVGVVRYRLVVLKPFQDVEQVITHVLKLQVGRDS